MRSQRLIVSFVAVLLAAAALVAQQRDPKQYANTLDNPDRIAALHVDQVVAALNLKPGMRVADLGSGSGVFTIPFAKSVGATGKVFAVDVDNGLLAIVGDKAKAAGLTNIQTVLAEAKDARIPDPVDLIFICDTMHHLPDQAEYVKQFAKQLKPSGRVAIIDFAEGKWPSGHESFTIRPAQVDGWMQAAGFSRDSALTFLPTNFFHIYKRAGRP
jgi:ubiquinone/menaquinone biosynthesis C-methylase UbiE